MQFKKLPVGDKMWKILCQFQVYLLHTHTQGKRKADRGGEIENTCKIHPSNAWHRALAAFNPTAMYPSVSIHLFPIPLHPSHWIAQSYWYTVCQARWSAARSKHVALGFNTPLTNPPLSSRWHASPGSGATGGLPPYRCDSTPGGYHQCTHVFG